MRVRLSTDGQVDSDVVVDADPQTPVGELAAALFPGTTASQLFLEGRPVDHRTPIGSSGLRDGVVLRRTAQHARRPAPGTLVLKVVAGPAAGTVIPLVGGRTVLGRGPGLPDSTVSRRHAMVTTAPEGLVTIEDLGSANGTTVEGRPVVGQLPLEPDALVHLGDSALMLARVPRADAALVAGADGSVQYNRPPRIQPPAHSARVVLPPEPSSGPGREWPIAMTLVPLAVGVLLAVVLRQPQYLLFTLISPVLLVTSVISERRKGRRSYRQAQREYVQARAEAVKSLGAALRQETAERRRRTPDAAELTMAALAPTSEVWSRHRHDRSFLDLRLGLAHRPAQTQVLIGREQATEQPTVADVPVTVPLLQIGILGIVGLPEAVRGLARWLLLQAAVLHSPRDLRVVLLTSRSAGDGWAWARWLPHLRPDDARSWCLVGNTPMSLTARITDLDELVERRQNAMRSRGVDAVDQLPAVLVVLDGSRALRTTAGLPRLLHDGPDVGVVFLCLDDQEALLPRECRAVVLVDAEAAELTLRRQHEDALEHVAVEQVDTSRAEAAARALAPLRDAEPFTAEGMLPSSLRLLDQLGLDPPTAADVQRSWQGSGRSTAFVLGVAVDGHFVLDLAAGPHALIAGTTGAGKSGLLQTMIASLAVRNRPDNLNFVLIDYKGGAAFLDCARLPHCVGMVTDLDGAATARALTSLRAELRRREALLKEAGSPDLPHYWARRDAGAVLEPLPRLVLCIDEFAQLVHEVPEFVRGIVEVAALGRSLGIHLVLATQHPAGVVTAAIKANTTIRIALRVADETSSIDVIEVPDAHRMPALPGRAFVKIGAAAPVAIQTARIDGPRPGVARARQAPQVNRIRWDDLGVDVPIQPEPGPAAGQETDLAAVVDAIRAAALELRIPEQRSPWLPALPTCVALDALAVDDPFTVPFGLEDLPQEQDQRPAVLDLRHGGHLLVGGAARSGRSTFLLTLAGSMASRVNPADVHLYAIDCGAALHPLTELPHCGAVVLAAETDRVDRLMGRLLDEIRRRERLLSNARANDLTELRTPGGDRVPYVVVMVDGYDAFAAAYDGVDGGRVLNEFTKLLRDGPRAGVRVILTGDRSTLIGRIASAVADRLVLRLANPNDYGMVGIPQQAVGDDPPPGRAVRAGNNPTSVQIATLGGQVSGKAQGEELARIGAGATAEPGERPFRVDPLPEVISYAEAARLPMAPPDATAFVGVGGDELSRIGVRIGDAGSLLVLGGRRTGRSTALRVVAESLIASGHALVLLTPRSSPLERVEGPAVRARFTGPDCATADIEAVLRDGPAVIMVDDLESVSDQPLGAALAALVKNGGGVVLGGSAEGLGNAIRGPALEAGRAGQGLVLCPSSASPGAVFGSGLRLPRSMVGSTEAGRGALLVDGEAVAVQVPLPP